MAYTYDENLEFLGKCSDEQLKDLADILIYDTDGKFRNTEKITSTNEYKKQENIIKYKGKYYKIYEPKEW